MKFAGDALIVLWPPPAREALTDITTKGREKESGVEVRHGTAALCMVSHPQHVTGVCICMHVSTYILLHNESCTQGTHDSSFYVMCERPTAEHCRVLLALHTNTTQQHKHHPNLAALTWSRPVVPQS